MAELPAPADQIQRTDTDQDAGGVDQDVPQLPRSSGNTELMDLL